MNVGGRPAGGNAQDPLNFLQRAVSESTKLSKRAKAHVLIAIRRIKQAGPYDWDQSAAHAFRVYAYAETLYLREHIDKLKATDRAYKPLLWAITKLSEVMCKFKTRKPIGPASREGQQKTASTALWQAQPRPPVPPESDGGTA